MVCKSRGPTPAPLMTVIKRGLEGGSPTEAMEDTTLHYVARDPSFVQELEGRGITDHSALNHRHHAPQSHGDMVLATDPGPRLMEPHGSAYHGAGHRPRHHLMEPNGSPYHGAGHRPRPLSLGAIWLTIPWCWPKYPRLRLLEPCADSPRVWHTPFSIHGQSHSLPHSFLHPWTHTWPAPSRSPSKDTP